MGNGLRYAIDRGPGGRVERITTGLPGDPTPDILDLTYSYDSAGNIISIIDAVDPDRTAFYGYDAPDRLVSADGWWGALDWTYDATGNRLSDLRNGAVAIYAYQSGKSRLLAVAGGDTHALEYDASGNATRYDDLLHDSPIASSPQSHNRRHCPGQRLRLQVPQDGAWRTSTTRGPPRPRRTASSTTPRTA